MLSYPRRPLGLSLPTRCSRFSSDAGDQQVGWALRIGLFNLIRFPGIEEIDIYVFCVFCLVLEVHSKQSLLVLISVVFLKRYFFHI